MCHHVDMAIDWDEVVTDKETEKREETTEIDKPAVDTEESTPEVKLPADD